MIIAEYASPIVTFMRKALFFIIIPIARGLDKLIGIHDHHRIQHKDFATYLTGNVKYQFYFRKFWKELKNDYSQQLYN